MTELLSILTQEYVNIESEELGVSFAPVRSFNMAEQDRQAAIVECLRKIRGNESLEYTAKLFQNTEGTLQDMCDLRKLVCTLFGEDYKYLLDDVGEMLIDRYHLLLLRGVLNNRADNYYAWDKGSLNAVLDIAALYCVVPQLQEELRGIEKHLKAGNVLRPRLNRSFTRPSMNKCEYFFRPYVPQLLKKQGYTLYAYKSSLLLEKLTYAHLNKQGLTEASQVVAEHKQGYFIPEIDIALENDLLPAILSGRVSELQGELVAAYKQEDNTIQETCQMQEGTKLYDFYHEGLNRLVYDFYASMIKALRTELSVFQREIGAGSKPALAVVYMSPEQFVIGVPYTYELSAVLPKLCGVFEKIGDFDAQKYMYCRV